MNIAILIIGHIRKSFNFPILNDFLIYFVDQKFNKFNKFNKCDIFVYTWDKYEASCGNTNIKNNLDPLVNVKYDTKLMDKPVLLDEIKEYFNFRITKIEMYSQENIKHNSQLYKGAKYMYWLNKTAGDDLKLYCDINNITYNTVLRMRPDIHKFTGFSTPFKNNIYINKILELHDNNTILGLLYSLGLAVGDCFYCCSLDTYIKLQNYIINNFDMLKENEMTPVELVMFKGIKDLGIKKICTHSLGSSIFYKILFGQQWFRKN